MASKTEERLDHLNAIYESISIYRAILIFASEQELLDWMPYLEAHEYPYQRILHLHDVKDPKARLYITTQDAVLQARYQDVSETFLSEVDVILASKSTVYIDCMQRVWDWIKTCRSHNLFYIHL